MRILETATEPFASTETVYTSLREGYLDPDYYLSLVDSEKICEAMKTIAEFEAALEGAGLLEEM